MKAPKAYKKKPVVIMAIQWTGDNCDEVSLFLRGALLGRLGIIIPNAPFTIATLEGDHQANIGDWIIKSIQGEFYPCKPDIFKQTYDPVSDEINIGAWIDQGT